MTYRKHVNFTTEEGATKSKTQCINFLSNLFGGAKNRNGVPELLRFYRQHLNHIDKYVIDFFVAHLQHSLELIELVCFMLFHTNTSNGHKPLWTGY